MVLTRKQAIEEARQQKKALATMGTWRRWLFIITALLAVLSYFGITSGGGWLIIGIITAILGVASLLMTLVVDISIRNGHRNVEKILESLK